MPISFRLEIKAKNMKRMQITLSTLLLFGLTFGLLLPMKWVRLVAAAEVSPQATEAQKPTIQQIEKQLGGSKVSFEENRGQFDNRVRYMARAAGSTIFLAADEIVYVLPLASKDESGGVNHETNVGERIRNAKPSGEDLRTENEEKKPRLAYALRMKLAGANPESTFAGEETLEYQTNYFKGSDQSKWQSEVPNHTRVKYENVYEGIGMVWHGKGKGETQYDFVVAPNADPNQISIEFDGADKLEIDAEGNLLISTPAGIVKQNKPYTYQETDGVKQEIESRFIIEQSKVKFSLGSYDRNKPLTIDPTVLLGGLAYSTFLGGAGNEESLAIAVDSAGSAFVTGYTESTGFPTTAGVFDTTFNGFSDVFVTKLNAAGSSLIYSTFIGGSFNDVGYGIAVDSSGNAFITGNTPSANFPTTVGAFDTIRTGVSDVFVTKLNATGSSLLYSTFIGGSEADLGYGIAVDSSGNAFLTGYTFFSNDFVVYPTTAGAFDTTLNGSTDVFVTKLNATGSSLVYSTFIGGNNIDFGNSIAVDSSGNAFVTGNTRGGNFPTTSGAFDSTFNGTDDVFVTKLNATGSSLLYSTFIGGNNVDIGNGIAVDSAGNVFVTGYTFSDVIPYPTTGGAFDTTSNGGVDVFVTKLNLAGSSLVYSTFIGGDGGDEGRDIALDSTGNAFVTGITFDGAIDYPTTIGAFDTTHNGTIYDAFVTKLNAAGSSLLYSSFIGGSGSDFSNGIGLDSSGNAYVTGYTLDDVTDYPTTAGAFDTTFNGGEVDVFVTKLDLAIPTAASANVNGRVKTSNGSGIARARVSITKPNGEIQLATTNPFGYYRFQDLAVGETYILNVSSKRYSFAEPTRVISLNEDLTDADFVADGK
jgi:Carboxypeptidase regulatory-like domain/Beta-propeller repeat